MQVEGVETWPTARAPVTEKPLRKQTTTEREAVSDGHVSIEPSYEARRPHVISWPRLSLNGTIVPSLNTPVDITFT